MERKFKTRDTQDTEPRRIYVMPYLDDPKLYALVRRYTDIYGWTLDNLPNYGHVRKMDGDTFASMAVVIAETQDHIEAARAHGYEIQTNERGTMYYDVMPAAWNGDEFRRWLSQEVTA